MMTKQEIRRIVKERLRNMKSEELTALSLEIQDEAINLYEYKTADVVLCYLALPEEVRTDLIIEKAWEQGKKVCVPALQETGYGISALQPEDELISGAASVKEPANPRWIDINEVDIAFLPGVAFDNSGGRLGHGAGHIDRMLAGRENSGLFKVGLAFGFQLFDTVPQDEFDIKMDKIIVNKLINNKER